jgi:intein/homing endonuclease
MLGDGSISKNIIKISLDSKSDKDYILYTSKLLKKLFGVDPTFYINKKARVIDLIIQRRNLVDFCVSVGLMVGNKVKKNVDIPDWIKKDDELSVACVRGLVDTDGCFYTHKYNSNGKLYKYTKIAFTSRCSNIIKSVSEILIKQGICVRITKDGNDIRIESKEGVKRYLKIFNTHNIKFKDKII